MATKHIICNLDFNGNQIENVVAQVLTGTQIESISSPSTGQFVYNSDINSLGYYNGTSWVYTSAGNVYEVDSLDDDSTTSLYAVYYGEADTTESGSINTKTAFQFRAIKAGDSFINLGTGTSSSKEYITISLNNITISKVTGLQDALDAKLDDSQLSTATALIETGESAASDTMIPSQKAVKTYVDNEINKVNTDIAGAMHFIGTWDGTDTIEDNITTSGLTKLRKGDYWIVSTAVAHSAIPVDPTKTADDYIESATGDFGLEAGDMIVAISDRASTSAIVKADFKVIDNSESADLVRLNATQTLTNKTISGSSNTFSNIPESAVTNLTTDLAAKVDKTSITTTSTLNSDTDTYTTTVPSDYTVSQVIQNINSSAVHYKKVQVTTGTTTTITASTHDCGLFPEVKVYKTIGSGASAKVTEVVTDVELGSTGDVTVSWNGAATSANPITIVIVGAIESNN